MLVLMLVYAVVGLSAMVVIGCADYPCYVSFRAEDSCIATFYFDKPQVESGEHRVQAFLTTYDIHWCGGGCHIELSETNSLDLDTSVLRLQLELDGSDLSVNGKELSPGSEFNRVNLLSLNPWVVSRIQFENLGLVTDCDRDDTYQRVVVVGSYGTETSGAKGILTLVVTGLGLLVAQLRLKAAQSTEVPRPQA